MRERLSNPRSLLDEARLAIRRAIKCHAAGGEGIGRYVTRTPLPRALHRFLMFEKEFDALKQRCDGGDGSGSDDELASCNNRGWWPSRRRQRLGVANSIVYIDDTWA